MINFMGILALVIAVLSFVTYIQRKQISSLKQIRDDLAEETSVLKGRLARYAGYEAAMEAQRSRQNEQEAEVERTPDIDLVGRANALFPGLSHDPGKAD